MMDDGRSPGDLIGEAFGAAGDTVKTIGTELKKMGQTATSQIGGANQAANKQPQVPDNTSGKPSGGTNYSLLEELKKVGQTAGSQISGRSDANSQAEDIESLKKKDEEFSKQEGETLRAKIDQIYREHAQKKAAEEKKKKEEAVMEMEKKRQKREEIQQLKKLEPPNPAVAKTRAEIKNYGAE